MQVMLDLDGVVADYFTAVEKLMGVEHYSHSNFDEAVAKIKHRDWLYSQPESTFFRWLEKLPNTDKLIEGVVNIFGEYSIITTPLRGHEMPSMAGKMAWIMQNLPIQPRDIIFTSNKAQYATPDRILIDDYRPNVDAWKVAGGIGIKYKALSKYYTADHIINELRRLKNSAEDLAVL